MLLATGLLVLCDVGPLAAATISATKTVTGTFTPGGQITYTIVLTNTSASTQNNNPGNEFTDVLPAQLTFQIAIASSGSILFDGPTNTLTWNGSIPGNGGTVTITVDAQIKAETPGGTVVSNQATVSFDADNNGTNESSALSDDPTVAGTSDPTVFTVAGPVAGAPIPTLDSWVFMLLAVLLALTGFAVIRRRRLT